MVLNTTTGKQNGDLVLGLSQALPNSENEWPLRSFQIVSFITLKPYDFHKINNLGNLWFVLSDGRFKGVSEDHVLDQNQINECHEVLERARDDLNYIGLVQTAKYVSNIRGKLNDKGIKVYGDYYKQVGTLWEMMLNEIEGMVFGFLPPEHGRYFNQAALFGDEVNDKFRGAANDIKEAGNCYAHGTYTACVFHLTRVLEVGLKALAATLKIEFKDLDAENWGTIIDRIESEIGKLNDLKRSSAKSETLDFYSGAAKQFRYFKDHWRNPVDHFRGRYDGPQALSALNHVKEFMQDIAPKIDVA